MEVTSQASPKAVSVEAALRRGDLPCQLLEAAPDATVIVDSDGVIIFANQQVQCLFGYASGELVGQPVEVLLPERFRQRHVAHRQGYMHQPSVRRMGERDVLCGRRKDGAEFPVEIMLSPVVFEGRALVSASIREGSFNKALRDSNEELLVSSMRQHELADTARESEQRARESEQRLGLAIERSPAVVFSQDRDLRYTWIRNAPGDWSPERVIGQTDADVLPPEAAANLMAPKRRVLETGERVREIVPIPREGQMSYWDLTADPIFDVDGTVVGIACMTFDVTEHVVAERELEALNESLQDNLRVSAESLNKKDRELQVAEQMAALGTVAAGLTHDLNNILFPIRCSLDALEMVGDTSTRSEVSRERLTSIRECTVYLQRLCENVRLLMAPGGSSLLEGKATDLHVWWEEVSGLVRSILPTNIELLTNLLPELPQVKLDRTLLTQVVFNLAHNAGRAMRRQRTGCLRISAESVEENTCVRLEVSDNGPGMTPEVKRRCLEMSFSTRDDEKASGIGLALVNSIVSRASGTIEIESEPGVGTTFSIVLPAA